MDMRYNVDDLSMEKWAIRSQSAYTPSCNIKHKALWQCRHCGQIMHARF